MVRELGHCTENSPRLTHKKLLLLLVRTTAQRLLLLFSVKPRIGRDVDAAVEPARGWANNPIDAHDGNGDAKTTLAMRRALFPFFSPAVGSLRTSAYITVHTCA